MGWIGWPVCTWDECVPVCLCVPGGMFVCVSQVCMACICVSVCVRHACLHPRPPTPTFQVEPAGFTKAQHPAAAPSGATCPAPLPPHPLPVRRAPAPAPSSPSRRPPFSPPPAVIEGTATLVSNHFLQFANWFLWFLQKGLPSQLCSLPS